MRGTACISVRCAYADRLGSSVLWDRIAFFVFVITKTKSAECKMQNEC